MIRPERARPFMRALLAVVLFASACKEEPKKPAEPLSDAPARSSEVASSGSAVSSDAQPEKKQRFVAARRELDMRLLGKKMGQATMDHTPLPGGGVKEHGRYVVEMKVKDDNSSVRRSVSEETYEYGADLELVKISKYEKENDNEEKVEVTVDGKKLRVVIDKHAHKVDKIFDVPDDFSNDLIAFETMRAEALKGTKLPLERRYQEFDDEDLAFEYQVLRVLERVKFDTPDGPIDAWKVEFYDEKDKETIAATLDDEGLPVHLAIEPLVASLRGTNTSADDEMLELDPYLKVEGSFTGAPLTLDVELIVKGDGANKELAILDSPYQKVSRDGDVYKLGLMAPRAKGAVKPPSLPIADIPADIAKYLKPTAESQSDDPDIVALGKQIASGETDSRKVGEAIVRWVFKELKKADGVRGSASASETLKARRGDCTEHAALVVALARSLGIPARNAGGIVLVPGSRTEAGYHAWPELWLGEWLVMDAALGTIEAGATYIWLEYDEPGEVKGPGLKRLVGRTSVVIK